MYSEITANDIMTKKLITLKPDDSIYLGLKMLLHNHISGAPVVDKEGTFVGMFTEKSCMNVIIADQYHGNSNTQVGDFLFTDIRTISPSTSLIEIGMIFLTEARRRLPVISKGKLLGQVSRRDVLRAVNKTQKKSYSKTKSQNPLPYYSALIDPLENNENL